MKAKYRVNAEITVDLTHQDIEDIIVTALEGGIGYWACLDNRNETFENAPEDEPVAITASKILLNGGGLTFLDNDDHSVEWLMTLKELLNGVKLYLETDQGPSCIENGRIECGMIDAEAADMIVQFALFDELVYV